MLISKIVALRSEETLKINVLSKIVALLLKHKNTKIYKKLVFPDYKFYSIQTKAHGIINIRMYPNI
jgi:hypothetical protein